MNTRSCFSCSRSIPASLTSFYTPSTTITLPYTSSHYSSFNVIVEESANKVDNIIQVGMNSLTKYLNLTTASASLLSWRRFTPVLRGLCRFPLLICNWAMQQYYIYCHLCSFSLKKSDVTVAALRNSQYPSFLCSHQQASLREGIKKNRLYLGKSPKLWVGGGQES